MPPKSVSGGTLPWSTQSGGGRNSLRSKGKGDISLAKSGILTSRLHALVEDVLQTRCRRFVGLRKVDTSQEPSDPVDCPTGNAVMATLAHFEAGIRTRENSVLAVRRYQGQFVVGGNALAVIAGLKRLSAIALVGALLSATVAAETAEEKGLEIAIAVDERGKGFGDLAVGGEMVLRDSAGRESRRVFRQMILERPGSDVGDMSVIVFERPRDTRGVALLTHANIEPEDDDQWLYLPALRRVKRISSSNRTGKFVASEFSYEDLGSQEVKDFDHKWLRDEPCPDDGELACHVVENYPKNRKSGYSKRVLWIDQSEFRFQRIEFYNRRGELEKDLTFSDYKQYLGRYWRASKLSMVNRQTGKSTDMLWSEYEFGVGLSESLFRPQRLQTLAR